MSISSIALIAALAALPMGQDAEPRVETRSEVRIVNVGGPDGPGRLDADEDGFVTREEFTAPLSNAFDRIDADDDGRLSAEELRSHNGDAEGHDGPVVLEMRRGGPGVRMFGGRGGHGPGDVMMFHGGPGGGDREVFVMRRGGPGGDVEAHGPGERRIEIRRFGGPDGHGDMDANDDGRVTEDEFVAPLREAFLRMDADRDGALEDGERGGPEGED
jgi:hypothetical protein